MHSSCVRNEPAFLARRSAPVTLLLLGLVVWAPLSRAQANLGPVTVGAGLRTSFEDTDPAVGNTTNQFLLNDVRLYVNGPVYQDVKFMFTTDIILATDRLAVLDAVAASKCLRNSTSGLARFPPPSDRANLLWPVLRRMGMGRVYTDGIQDGYPLCLPGLRQRASRIGAPLLKE